MIETWRIGINKLTTIRDLGIGS
eukprot:COSAG01_NODE_7583_length_3138_cov_39.878578_1_plen_22_part_10